MKTLILIAIFAAGAFGQCTDRPNDPCVPVNQSVIDRSVAAVAELVESRKVIAAFTLERTASTLERESATRLIDRLNAVIAVQDKLHVEYEAVIALYKDVIKMQADLIDKLGKQLSKPKSAFNKFLTVLKEVALIAVGITFGRGL